MGSTLREWDLVVYFFGVHQPAFLQAQLTQWMLLDVAVTDALPGTAIPATGVGVTVILLITLCFLLGVFLAEPAVSQPGTAGIGTGAFRFPWHRFTSCAAAGAACT